MSWKACACRRTWKNSASASWGQKGTLTEVLRGMGSLPCRRTPEGRSAGQPAAQRLETALAKREAEIPGRSKAKRLREETLDGNDRRANAQAIR